MNAIGIAAAAAIALVPAPEEQVWRERLLAPMWRRAARRLSSHEK